MIRNLGLFIKDYNDDENISKVRTHLEELGLFAFTDLPSFICDHSPADSYAFTDDRDAADKLIAAGFGFAVYDHEPSLADAFPDALYIIDQITAMNVEQIDRMLLRFLRLPWTIATTERCVIREITEDDVDALYRIYGESPLAFQYTEGLFDDPEDERNYTRDYIDHQYRFMEYGIWIVTDRETGEVIGRAGVSNREGYEDAELGYGFALSYRHKGYATEVCQAILTYAKEALGMDRLNAFTIRENTDSVNLLKRLGFRFVTTAPLGNVMHDLYQVIL